MSQTTDVPTVRLIPRDELKGLNYGIEFFNEDDIYVSPAIHSLYKTDPEAILINLRVKVMSRDSKNNPFRKSKKSLYVKKL